MGDFTAPRGRRTIAHLVFSEAERVRIAPLRLRAMLAEAALQGAEFCILPADGCEAGGCEVQAHVWRDGEWRRERRGLPDVLIVRATPVLKAAARTLEWLRSVRPVIAAAAPDKLGLHDRLMGSAVERYLIPQRALPDEGLAEAIADWLRERRSAVIKPAESSRGKRVHFILPQGDAWAYRRDLDTVVCGLGEAVEAVVRQIAGRTSYRAYLVQDYVRSVTPDGRAFHIRVDVHKDGRGEWRLVNASGTVGEIGYSVSNQGFYGKIERAVKQRRARPPGDICEEAKAAALAVARALDGQPGVVISELGVDLALDDDDRIWLIEANALPLATLHELERARFAVEYSLAVADGLPIGAARGATGAADVRR